MGSRRHRHSRRNRHLPARRKYGVLLAVVGALALTAGIGLLIYSHMQESDLPGNQKLHVAGLIYTLTGCVIILIQRALFHMGQIDT